MRTTVPVTVAALLAALVGSRAQAQALDSSAVFRATTLTLSAYGETRVEPDMAMITIGVRVDGKTAAEAVRLNAQRMTDVIATLQRAGIEARDVQTSGLGLSPTWAYRENEPPKLTGYQATNQVTVTVRDLTRLGAAVDASVDAGANTIDGIVFGLKESVTAENAARVTAVKAVQAKAELYAAATGHRIVRLVTLGESGGLAPPTPMPMFEGMARQAAVGTPVQPGELHVRIDVAATYELERQ